MQILPRMPRIRLQLLALLCTLTSLYSVTECSDVIQLRGEVGGNVTFQCPVDESRPLEFCYFQTSPTSFVNGYYDSKDMTPYLSYLWNNTRMANNTVMYMYDLTVAHGIDYKCIFKYKGSKTEPEIKIRLTVTAKYSKPEVTVRCGVEGNDLSCLVTCTSHGGYPDSEVMWDAAENQKCKIVNNSKKTDPQTMLFTRSSTAYFNCTNGNVTSSRCSVGHVSSDEFTVCMTKDPQKSPGNVVMFAIVVAIATLFITVIAVLCYLRKRKGGNGGAELRIEVNGCNPTELDTLRSTEEV